MPTSKLLDLAQLRHCVAAGRFEWRKHVLQRLAERGLPQSAVLRAIQSGTIIRDYADDYPYPSALILGGSEGKSIHVVVALDTKNNWGYIVTAYEPDSGHFESNQRTRKPR